MKVLFQCLLAIFFYSNLNAFDEQINEISLPELGDRVSGAVSSSQEKAIGEMFLQQVYSQAPLISDPLLFDYTEHLIYRLSEYSQVKREHKKMERKVSQIHRYTTITFVTGVIAAAVALTFSATLYFKSISELKLMTTTNREGLIVFSENIDKLNVVLAELQVSLAKQEELVKLNREATAHIAELNDAVSYTHLTLPTTVQV